MKWLPIEDCPKDHRIMFVAIAIDVKVTPNSERLYTTDPYCVWWNDHLVQGDERWPQHPKTHFSRWPHPFPPTHFCLLPETKGVNK